MTAADSTSASPLIIALAAGLALIVGFGGASVTPDATEGAASPSPEAADTWTRPTSGDLSSPYGRRCLGATCRMHTGSDLSVSPGTPVVAVHAGVVASARCASAYCDRPGHLGLGGYGNLVTLTHPGGVETRYAHLRNFTVTPGQQISAGETVGYSGSTGNSTGPHLHFEIKVDGGFVDPVPFLRERGVRLDADPA